MRYQFDFHHDFNPVLLRSQSRRKQGHVHPEVFDGRPHSLEIAYRVRLEHVGIHMKVVAPGYIAFIVRCRKNNYRCAGQFWVISDLGQYFQATPFRNLQVQYY